jgi:glutamine synthetase
VTRDRHGAGRPAGPGGYPVPPLTAVTIVDNAGVARAKVVPSGELARTAASGVGLSPVLNLYLVDDTIADGPYGAVGDLRLIPALSAARRLTPFMQLVPANQHDQDGAVHPTCQRSFLTGVIDELAEQGIGVIAGYEIEWTLYSGAERVADGPSYSLSAANAQGAFLAELHARLRDPGLEPQQMHAEYGIGQFELASNPLPLLEAADSSVFVRELIRIVAAEHGMRASFAPLIEVGSVGNGQHWHLSLESDQGNLFAHGIDACTSPPTLRGELQAFCAGLVAHLPALTCLAAAGPLSAARLKPGLWSGAAASVGVEDRDSAVRVAGTGLSTNVEVKIADASANPYLLLGGIVRSGMHGVSGELKTGTDWPPEVMTDVAQLCEALERDTYLADALGPTRLACYTAVRRAEAQLSACTELPALIDLLRWTY